MVAAKHPCNEFISQFHNALIYTRPEEFSANLLHAAANEPRPLTKDERYQLSWEAATERCAWPHMSDGFELQGPAGVFPWGCRCLCPPPADVPGCALWGLRPLCTDGL